MKPISGKHNYSYDELTSAISLIDSSGSKIKQNIPSFEAKNITKNKNIVIAHAPDRSVGKAGGV